MLNAMPAAADHRHLAEQLALILTEHGMQRMPARVMAAFIYTEQPTLTQGELADELGAGAGSISAAIKTLTAVGLLERVPVPGSRRDHHRLREDAWTTLFTSQNQALDRMLDAARTGVRATEPDSLAHHRLDRMRGFYEFVRAELPAVLKRWEDQQD